MARPRPMTISERDDPFLSYQFRVEVDNIAVAGFSEVSGLDIETDVERFREGGENLHERQLAGPAKFPSRLVLKRGMGAVRELWGWHQEVCRGQVTRKNVAIVLFDNSSRKEWRWRFREAVPVKWTGPQFRGSASEIAVETLELIHRGLIPPA